MAFAKGPYQTLPSLPGPGTTTIHSSRKMNFATKRYVFDSDGNAEGMDSTTQRVIFTVSFAAPEPPRFLTDRDMEQRRQLIRGELQDLIDEGAIDRVVVTVRRTSAGKGKELIKWHNLETGITESVSRTST